MSDDSLVIDEATRERTRQRRCGCGCGTPIPADASQQRKYVGDHRKRNYERKFRLVRQPRQATTRGTVGTTPKRAVRKRAAHRGKRPERHYRVGLDLDDTTQWLGEAIAVDPDTAKRRVAGAAAKVLTLDSFVAVPLTKLA